MTLLMALSITILFSHLYPLSSVHYTLSSVLYLPSNVSPLLSSHTSSLLSSARPLTIELMVCGSAEVDIALLESVTEYSSCSAQGGRSAHHSTPHPLIHTLITHPLISHTHTLITHTIIHTLIHTSLPSPFFYPPPPPDKHVRYFWQALKEFNNEERSALIRFTWGRSRLPLTAAGFTQNFKIQSFGRTPADSYFPVAHTCFFSLELPAYSSLEVMKSKLRWVVDG